MCRGSIGVDIMAPGKPCRHGLVALSGSLSVSSTWPSRQQTTEFVDMDLYTDHAVFSSKLSTLGSNIAQAVIPAGLSPENVGGVIGARTSHNQYIYIYHSLGPCSGDHLNHHRTHHDRRPRHLHRRLPVRLDCWGMLCRRH